MENLRKVPYDINLENGEHPEKIRELLNKCGASQSTVGLQIVDFNEDKSIVRFIPCRTEVPVSNVFLKQLYEDELIEIKDEKKTKN